MDGDGGHFGFLHGAIDRSRVTLLAIFDVSAAFGYPVSTSLDLFWALWCISHLACLLSVGVHFLCGGGGMQQVHLGPSFIRTPTGLCLGSCAIYTLYLRH